MSDYDLHCYQIHDVAPEIVPGRSRRRWMDEFAVRQPYRCLPLTMANSTGWEIICPFDITIEWNGGPGAEDIVITSETKGAHVAGLAMSHFRSGIVTFHTGYIFRTPPGIALTCMGPPNEPKDGIYALSGLVETDWLPFPFTMNWQMTRPGTVRFEKGECFCFFTLTEHMQLEEITPRISRLDDEPELKGDYQLWSTSRSDFIERLNAREDTAVQSGWQKDYMRGRKADGSPVEAEHLTKRRLQSPKKG